jgi:ADP-ribose pyrophosphatase YjhB (NUDIX family)
VIYIKFVLCVDGVLLKDARIFLAKRNVQPYKGYWHLVGGHVDENENPKDALKREFLEETNLKVKIGELIDGRIEKTFDRTKIILVFQIIDAKGRIRLNAENSESGWFVQVPKNSVYDYSRYMNVLPSSINEISDHKKNQKLILT